MSKSPANNPAPKSAPKTTANPDDVFDVGRVRQLIELMQEFDLAEVDLRQAEQRIRLRKDIEPVVVSGGYPASYAPTPAAPAAGSSPAPAVSAGSASGSGAAAAPSANSAQRSKNSSTVSRPPI